MRLWKKSGKPWKVENSFWFYIKLKVKMREKGKPNWHECSLRHWITGKLDKSAPKVFAMLFNIFSLFNVIMLRSFGLTVHNERIFMAENRHQWQLYRDLCISFLRRMHVEITNSFFKMQIRPFLSMRPPHFLLMKLLI